MLLNFPPDLTFVLTFTTVTSFLAQLFELVFHEASWTAQAGWPGPSSAWRLDAVHMPARLDVRSNLHGTHLLSCHFFQFALQKRVDMGLVSPTYSMSESSRCEVPWQ